MDNQITFEEFKKSFDNYRNNIKEISIEEFKVLWFDDYYDGMLCGILEYKNEKFRFEIITDITNNNKGPRFFAVITISENQLETEIYWNKQFQQFVGNHNNLDSDEELRQRPQNIHHLFYDDYKTKYNTNYNKNFIGFWYVEK